MKQIRIRHVLRVSLLAGGVVWFLSLASLAEAQTLRSPVRIAFAPNGNLLVSDYRQQTIFTLDSASLQVLDAFPIKGRPLAVGQWGSRLYVGNESEACVEVYDLSGKKPRFLYNLGGKKRNETVTVQHPTDLAIDASLGRVFVVDGYDKIIKVFDANGPLLYTIPGGGPAPDPNLLTNPTAIALDENNQHVLVSDYGDPSGSFGVNIPARVQIFDYDARDLGGISGTFSRPQGLAVDGSGHIFLADAFRGVVLVFDRATGSELKILGGFGSGPGQLFLPWDVVIDGTSKDVFVTSNRPGRVEVFRGGGLIP